METIMVITMEADTGEDIDGDVEGVTSVTKGSINTSITDDLLT